MKKDFMTIFATNFFRVHKLGKGFFFLLFTFFVTNPVCSQSYTLNEIIEYAQKNSPEAIRIETAKENKYWQWRTYKSNYKPQLVLNSEFPYQNRNIPVLQDDGSIVYRRVNQSEATVDISLEQNISLTGGKLFLSSDLSRVDNFDGNMHSYSNSPFYIGIEQPVFRFNELKWMNKIEPLKYEESQREFIENNERIAYNTAYHFFNLLIAQINLRIANANLQTADTIFKTGQEKYAMGKISRNELLQLKFGVITAQKSKSKAMLSRETSQLELSSYTGLLVTETATLAIPDKIHHFFIDDSMAVEKALENSQRSLAFKREVLEAQRDLVKAKRESGLNANLQLSYGTTNVANDVTSLYREPQTLQTVNIGLSIPILDWGRAKAKRETALANLKLAEHTVEQDRINFRQEIITQVEYFSMLQGFIEYTRDANQTATERYEIARLRYIAEDISLTEYNIALEQKDYARQDYITALRDYWVTYYTIRILTLHDFENNRQLSTIN
ncbi:TolC family protein [Maribellus maritimus]|uniref:TolC family protein n=1 Tax=Maribellus maritimus TaxID=2870838 RepID=UPI001EECEC49|nr:TolC family protein [Maribellus maritimus]MCG6187900.1 TolC family protein [Maribellus maritimus]